MSTVRVEAELSPDQLLSAVQQLPPDELERFLGRVLALSAQRKAPSLPKAEADLLLEINKGLPAMLQKRYSELIAKRRLESLTEAEYQELLRLAEQVERIEVRRVECLVELARLRRVSLDELMDSLGIQPAVSSCATRDPMEWRGSAGATATRSDAHAKRELK